MRGADEPVCGAAHLTLPTLRLGPSLSPLKGGEGLVSAGIILVERDASRAIKFSSPDSPAPGGGGLGRGRRQRRRTGLACNVRGLALRGRSLLRQGDRDLVEAHRIFKDQLIERIFP